MLFSVVTSQMFTHVSQGASVIVARPDDSYDLTVNAHVAINDYTETLYLR